MIHRRLKTDFSWVLSGNALFSASQWGIVVAISKLSSAREVGEYALGLAVSAPVVQFANFQLRALLASDVKDQIHFGQYLAFRLVTLTAAMLVLAAVAIGVSNDMRIAAIILMTGLVQSLDFVSETYHGQMQKQDRMDRVSSSLMMKGSVSLALFALVLYTTNSLLFSLAGLAVGRLIVLLSWDSRCPGVGADGVRLQWNAGIMKSILRLAYPLGIISTLIALTASVPRYFLEALSGTSELGIFSAIATLLSVGNLVVAAYGQALFVPVATACAERDRAKLRHYAFLALAAGSALGVAGVVGAMLFGREILGRVFRPEYAERADILIALMLAGAVAFIASSIGYVVTAARNLRAQIPVQLAAMLAAGITAAWSIPVNGLKGAAEAVLLAALVQLIGMLILLIQIDREFVRNRRRPLPTPGVRSQAIGWSWREILRYD